MAAASVVVVVVVDMGGDVDVDRDVDEGADASGVPGRRFAVIASSIVRSDISGDAERPRLEERSAEEANRGHRSIRKPSSPPFLVFRVSMSSTLPSLLPTSSSFWSGS